MAEQTGGISNYCWRQNPTGAGNCVLNRGHSGNHYDWYARSSWDQPGAEWPQEKPTR